MFRNLRQTIITNRLARLMERVTIGSNHAIVAKLQRELRKISEK